MSINWQAMSNWDKSVTDAQLNTLTTDIQTFNNAWASLCNKITTQGYHPTASDLTDFNGTGSTSLKALYDNLNTYGLLQALENLYIDNCAVGPSGNTGFPSTDSASTTITDYITNTYGVGAPNNSAWTHYGVGWTDYVNQNAVTFEGISNVIDLTGGIATTDASGSIASDGILSGPSGTGWPWTVISGSAFQLAVHASNDVYALSGDAVTGGYKVFHWNGSAWSDLNGGLTSISVGSDGVLFGLNSSGNAYYWNGAQWFTYTQPTTFTELKVGTASSVYARGSDTNVYLFDSTTSTWNRISGTNEGISNIRVSKTDGTLFAFGSNSHMYKWTGSAFQDIGTWPTGWQFDDIYAVSANLFYRYQSDTTDQLLYKWDGSTWSQIPEAPNAGNSLGAIQYVGDDGSIWSFIPDMSVLGTTYYSPIYQYTGGAWVQKDDGFWIKVLVVAKDGTKWALAGPWLLHKLMRALGINCGSKICQGLVLAAIKSTGFLVKDLHTFAKLSVWVVLGGASQASVMASLKEALTAYLMTMIIIGVAGYVCGCSWADVWGK